MSCYANQLGHGKCTNSSRKKFTSILAVAGDGARLAISAIFRPWGPKEWNIAQKQWGLLENEDESSDASDEINFPCPVWQSDSGFNDGEIMLMWIDEVLLHI